MGERPGSFIGRYRLLEITGEGGFGTVWMAEQAEPVRRKVALKIIKLGMDTRAVVARFEAERQALALMDHPNIARVFDGGATDAGRPFFVMELVRGVPFTTFCDARTLSTRERIELFLPVCRAVQHAHQKGVIHRDLKPSNILVTEQDGRPAPKVIDFGIARATEERLTDKTLFTRFHQFLGTPAYMSPEQAGLGGLDIDTRSDIYSLGVLLYEVLTGHTPFDTRALVTAGHEAVLKTIREQEPSRPSTRLNTLAQAELTTVAARRGEAPAQLNRRLRGELDWILLKALEKDRNRRYESANGLAADLQRHLDAEPVQAAPPSLGYQFGRFARRHRTALVTAAAFAAVLLAGSIVSTTQAVRATAAASHARQRSYVSDMHLAQQSLALDNLGRAQELLERHRPEGGQADLRGWEWRYLWQYCRSDAQFTLCEMGSGIHSLSVSHDGDWVAAGDEGGRVSVRDLQTRREVVELTKGNSEVMVAFSPAELLLAFSGTTHSHTLNAASSVCLWDGATGKILRELPLGSRCVGLKFSSDGRKLWTSTLPPEGRVTCWQVGDGTILSSHPAAIQWNVGRITEIVPQLSVAAHGAPLGNLRVIDPATGRERWSALAAEQYVTAMAFSPEGKTLASGAGYAESTIRLWDVASGTEKGRLEGHRGWVGDLAFLPDGTTLVSASADQTIRLWDTVTKRSVGTLRGHRLEVWRLAIVPNRPALISGSKDGSVCVWDTAKTRLEGGFVTIPAPVAGWSFSTNGQSILACSRQGQVARWSGANYQQCQPLLELGGGVVSACFSGRDRLMATSFTNGSVQMWDLDRRSLLWQIGHPESEMIAWKFRPGTERVVLVNRKTDSLHEFEGAANQPVESWHGGVNFGRYYGGCFTPDGKWCLTFGYEGQNFRRNILTKHNERLPLDLTSASDAAISPDGRLLAAASHKGFAKIWDAATCQEIATLRGFLVGVHAIAFSPDGTRLVTGSAGSEAIRVWDANNHLEMLTLEGKNSLFEHVTFSPDGNTIGSASTLGILHLWHAPSWDEIKVQEGTDTKPHPDSFRPRR